MVCKNCGKETGKKKWCSAKCREYWRYHNLPEVRQAHLKSSMEQLERVNKSTILKKRRREYFKKWVNKNRPKFNEYMREHMRNKLKTKPENYKV